MLVRHSKIPKEKRELIRAKHPVSSFLHLESQEPLFKRIVSIGGTPLLLKPIPSQVAESVYSAVMEKLDLTASSPKERISALKNTTVENLLAATSNFPLLPIIDGDLITAPATFSKWSFQEKPLPGTEWCESIMIGDCELDVSLNLLRFYEGADMFILVSQVFCSTCYMIDSTGW